MNNMIIANGNKKTSEIIHQPKSKTCLPKKIGFSFSANTSPKREPISNVGNLREDSYHRDYTLWKNDLNGLNPNS